MKLILFLGSGVSLDSGFPSTHDLTGAVFNPKWSRYTGGGYFDFGKSTENEPWNNAPVIMQLLRELRAYENAYLEERRGRQANYEDIAFLVQQIADEESGDMENPFVRERATALWRRAEELRRGKEERSEFQRTQLFENMREYISCVVWQEIHRAQTRAKTPQGLELICQLARSDAIRELDIVTLNHDVLVETLLDSRQIGFVDGFGPANGEVKYFDPSLYDGGTARRLFKLHGSVTWFRFLDNETGMARCGIPVHGDNSHSKDAQGRWLWTSDSYPLFLVGTVNKMIEYARGVFRDIHFRFQESLKHCTRMVMSGYGWCDKGINRQLLEWLLREPKNRLFLLHKYLENLKRDARPAFRNNYRELVTSNRLVPIEKWLSDVRTIDDLINEIAEALDLSREKARRFFFGDDEGC